MGRGLKSQRVKCMLQSGWQADVRVVARVKITVGGELTGGKWKVEGKRYSGWKADNRVTISLSINASHVP